MVGSSSILIFLNTESVVTMYEDCDIDNWVYNTLIYRFSLVKSLYCVDSSGDVLPLTSNPLMLKNKDLRQLLSGFEYTKLFIEYDKDSDIPYYQVLNRIITSLKYQFMSIACIY
jgi:hypothetical protein